MEKETILKVLVGSRAYNLSSKDSDYDYHGVFVAPTEEVLSLFKKYKGTDWIEGNEDNVNYEIRHFLELALHCNPTILEVFHAPIVDATEEGHQLRELFWQVADDKRMRDAFTGYGFNQRKKMINNKDGRWSKYGMAYIRVLYQYHEWVSKREFPIRFTETMPCYALLNQSIRATLKDIRDGYETSGSIIDIANEYISSINLIYLDMEENNSLMRQTPEKVKLVNDFLLGVRRNHLGG